jgi:hypothetical protein
VRLRGNDNSKNEMRGSLHCAPDDETVRCSGRDDEVLVGGVKQKQQLVVVVAGLEVFEAGVVGEVGEVDAAGGAVALFGDDDFGFAF